MCNAVLDNFGLVISHFRRVHREDPNFFVTCGINGVEELTRNFMGTEVTYTECTEDFYELHVTLNNLRI